MSALVHRLRAAALVGIAAATVSLATGCTTSPGAAAVVGNDSISTQTLQNAVDAALKDPAAQQQVGTDRAAFVRDELGRLINDIIIGRAAAEEHLNVTPSDIDQATAGLEQRAGGHQQLLQAASAGGVPPSALPTFLHYYVLQQKLVDRLLASVPIPQTALQAAYNKQIDSFDRVHSAHILVKTKKQADQLLAQVRKNPSSFASLAQRFSLDTGSKASGGDLGFQGRSAFVKPFSDAIFAAKPGTFVEAHSQFGWHVIHVIAHQVTPLAQAASQIKAQLLQSQAQAVLQSDLSRVGKHLGVHVNPRYGVWNNTKGSVDPTPASHDVSSPVATPTP